MTLAEEAQRYLAVVETFRAQGCEPHWRRETSHERAWLSSPAEHVPADPREEEVIVSKGRKP
jgi:hypothetical protein